ncbi:copper chaperone for superoxide dismutase-like [Tigriopus californicus]|nr:copper chaperone for superoxide dismutase-like [Tigriopus californicus]
MEGESVAQFSVNLTCQSCVEKTEKVLKGVPGINKFQVDLARQSVVVNSTLPSEAIISLIESTGKKAVMTGSGGLLGSMGAAVAAIGGAMGIGAKVKGVVRFTQVDESTCVVDGTIDGLSPGKHALAIHECGDLTQGCKSVGAHFNPRNTRHGSPLNEENERHVGDLGNISADESGRAVFKFSDKLVKVWDIIGRSVVVAEGQDDLGQGYSPLSQINGNCGNLASCGIIARSAGLLQNDKKFCACDGVTIWDERNRPIAGSARRNPVEDASKL